MRLTLAFLALFAAYQLPEGVGQPVLLLAFFPLAYIAGRMLSFTAARAYGLEWSRDAAVVTPAFFALAVLLKLGAVAAGLHLAIYQTDTPRTAGVATALSAGLLMTFLPSIAEDILTRGFWFRASGIRWTPWVFVAASSAIYVANHIYRLHLGYGEWLMLATFGVAYALAVMRFQSLWPAVGLELRQRRRRHDPSDHDDVVFRQPHPVDLRAPRHGGGCPCAAWSAPPVAG